MDKSEVLNFIMKQISWLGQSGFRITTLSGKIIYIDPYRVPQNSPKADYIFLTHPHGDHFNPKVVKALQSSHTTVIAPMDMAKVASDPMNGGDEKNFDEVWVKTFPAYNRRGLPHPIQKNWLGFLIRFNDFTLYHAGDTDEVPDFGDLKPDLALLPIAGFVTLGIFDGVKAAHKVGAVVTAPIHYGLIPGTAKNGEKFVKAYPGASVIFTKEPL